MSFTMKTLTEGIRQRHMGATHQRLTEKWNRTGLLRGLNGYNRENMSVLLENQAAQLLRETNMLGSGNNSGGGNIRGFQNVAFPIVRRVFGGLVANELVSVQPMSLPSGLLFYLDYTYGTSQGGVNEAGDNSVYTAGQSIYNQPTGADIQSGSLGTGGQYDLLGSGYSRRHDDLEITVAQATTTLPTAGTIASGIIVPGTGVLTVTNSATGATGATELGGAVGRLTDFDSALAQYLDDSGNELIFAAYKLTGSETGINSSLPIDTTMINDICLIASPSTASSATADQLLVDISGTSLQAGAKILNIRRHTKRVDIDSSTKVVTVNPLGGEYILFACAQAAGADAFTNAQKMGLSFAVASSFSANSSKGDALTVPSFEADLEDGNANTTGAPVIPEIDIKIESLAVTAVSRKLKAKWSPELAQDLNAYHSLDAEVELTQILSEQIALELDREILNDLLVQANGANLFWSRAPGKFVNELTGVEIARNSSLRPGPQFTGTVRDWYETLIETIIDAGNIIHRKTLRGSANFIVIGPDVATIFESSVMYKPSYSIDGQGQASALSIGAEKIGNLSNRFTVYKDPYFPRNKVLIGYKGGSYLETGYVYAPYVPLIVTPTIFAPEDFTPRKGVMTRYGKKMVRSDFYGTVTCLDMNII